MNLSFLKWALLMVKKAHNSQSKKSGNTNYFVIGIIIVFLLFNKAEIGGVIFTTKDQQDMTRDVILLKEDWPEFKKSICDLSSSTSANTKSIEMMNYNFENFKKDAGREFSEIKELLKNKGRYSYAD